MISVLINVLCFLIASKCIDWTDKESLDTESVVPRQEICAIKSIS